MSEVAGFLVLAAGFATSRVLTRSLWRSPLARRLIDVPNSRSSHAAPTPRGGGVAVIIAFLGSLVLLAIMGALPGRSLLAIAGAGLMVGGIGWLDDHGHVAARWRLLTHFLAAGWALYWLNGLPPLPVFGVTMDLGWIGHALGLLYLVWLLNLYNFMDGINGIAGIEAVTVGVGGWLLYQLSAASMEARWIPIALAVSAAGFLCWNFPRARIFMGDVGSGFLGITLGVLSIDAGHERPELFWAWVILLGTFVVDATITLVRRMARGEPAHEAHRCHAYQHAARKWGSHTPVSLAVGLINLLWLLPIAGLVSTGRVDGVAGLLLAYAPLAILVVRNGAGLPENPGSTVASGVGAGVE